MAAKKSKNSLPAAAVLVAAGFGFVYLATLTRCYSTAAVADAWQVTRFDRSANAALLFHPDHLLFNGLCDLFYRLLALSGNWVHPLLAAQILNALIGAVGLWFFFGLAMRLSDRKWPALLATAGLGSTFAYWAAATNGGSGLVGIVLVILALRFGIEVFYEGHWETAALMGAMAGAAVLFKQNHFLLLPMILVASAMAAKGAENLPARTTAGLGAFFALIGIPYASIYSATHGGFNLQGLLSWMALPSETGAAWDRADYLQSLRAFSHALLTGEPYRVATGGASSSFDHWMAAAFVMIVFGMAVALFWGVLKLLPWGRDRRPLALCLLLGLTYVVYLAIYPSGDPSDWLPAAVAFWGIVVLTTGRWKAPELLSMPQQGLLILGVAGMLVINFWYNALPGMSVAKNPTLTQTLRIRDKTDRGDMILLSGVGKSKATEIYLRYFTQREVIALDSALDAAQQANDRDYVGVLLADLRRKIHATHKHGGRVFVMDELVRSDKPYVGLQQRHQLSRNVFLDFMDSYIISLGFITPGAPIWELKEKE